MLLGRLTHAQKECTHQLALPWGSRHLISPALAGKDVIMILFLQAQLPYNIRSAHNDRKGGPHSWPLGYHQCP